MRHPCWFGIGLAITAIVVGGLQYRAADGCAALPPLGRYVAISDETAIIVWDKEQQLEHFIRSATFETDAENFGFLVPTPSQPTLHEVDQGAFRYLAQVTAPEIKLRQRGGQQESSGCGCSSSPNTSAAPSAPPPVRVLEEKRIAGHDAAVLEADNAEELAAWLKDHDYPSSPQLSEWLQPYIAEKWKITAFKYAKDAATEPNVASAAIRLTFKTEKPLYPYREPKAAEQETEAAATAAKSRLLRVYFVADSRYQGELGEPVEPWSAKTAWAGKLNEFRLQHLSQQLKLEDFPILGKWWLTEFEDSTSPRPTEHDLFFTPAKDQHPIERPPVYAAHAPRGDAAMYLLAAGTLAVYAYGVRRRGKSTGH